MSVDENHGPRWHASTLGVALIGSLLLWAALPPLAIGWLGWIAPVPWLLLIKSPELPGKWPYRSLYAAGLVFWLAAIHWLRLPHPLVYAGWFALSAYLACYLPAFVGLSRVAVHRLGMPLWLAAPVVWTGLELARAHVMTGFLMGSLAHTQVQWTGVIQIADLFGEYGVDFLIMLVAAGGASFIRNAEFRMRNEGHNPPSSIRTSKFALFTILPAVIALSAALAYGHLRLSELTLPADARTVRIALIQGNSLADWKIDPKKQRQIMEEYVRLSQDAVAKARATGTGKPLDLIVWPETMFRIPLMSFDPAYRLPSYVKESKEKLAAAAPEYLAQMAKAFDTPVLVGIDRQYYGRIDDSATSDEDRSMFPTAAYNSAVLVGRDGQIVETYDKYHLVMFGEYVPFARWLPFLKQISSLTGSVEAGAGPRSLPLEGVVIGPSICYETVIPHVTRRQAREPLEGGSLMPDVLINMTNDAWYWGSSELDQHLASGVFRTIENRIPLVISANGGITAWIDHSGRVQAQSPKQQPDVLIADVALVHEFSWYGEFGDMFAGACLTCCLILAIIGWKSRGALPVSPPPLPPAP